MRVRKRRVEYLTRLDFGRGYIEEIRRNGDYQRFVIRSRGLLADDYKFIFDHADLRNLVEAIRLFLKALDE